MTSLSCSFTWKFYVIIWKTGRNHQHSTKVFLFKTRVLIHYSKTTLFSNFFVWLKKTPSSSFVTSFGRSTLVIRCPVKSLSSVCMSVHLSVCPSITKFSEDWVIIFFADVVHDDSWPWYLVTSKARFLKETKLTTQIWFQWVQIRPKMRLFGILLSLDHTFTLKLRKMMACDNV